MNALHNVSAAASPRTATRNIVLAFAAVYLIWGSTYLTIRISVETIPPMLMSSARFMLSGAVIFLVMRIARRSHEPLTARQWRDATIIGGCLLLGGNGIVSWGEQYVGSGYMALVVATAPMWMAALAPLFGGRRIGIVTAVGLTIGLAGVVLLVHPGTSGLRWQSVAVLASPLSWSIGSLYAQKASMPRNALTATGMEMLAGGALMGIVGLAAGEAGRLHVASVSGASWIAFGYLVLFGSLIGYSSYIWLLSKVSITSLSTYAYVNPLVAVILGAIVLHETITPVTLGAAALIVFAVALILSERARSHHQTALAQAAEAPVRDVA
jgi:drug/metabolite transporter (DMT)-like permease